MLVYPGMEPCKAILVFPFGVFAFRPFCLHVLEHRTVHHQEPGPEIIAGHRLVRKLRDEFPTTPGGIPVLLRVLHRVNPALHPSVKIPDLRNVVRLELDVRIDEHQIFIFSLKEFPHHHVPRSLNETIVPIRHHVVPVYRSRKSEFHDAFQVGRMTGVPVTGGGDD